ncbi:hypothetical protein ACLOJK_001236 [Asimina triloba]
MGEKRHAAADDDYGRRSVPDVKPKRKEEEVIVALPMSFEFIEAAVDDYDRRLALDGKGEREAVEEGDGSCRGQTSFGFSDAVVDDYKRKLTGKRRNPERKEREGQRGQGKGREWEQDARA